MCMARCKCSTYLKYPIQYDLFLYFSENYALIIEQSFGVWHTKCFTHEFLTNNTAVHSVFADICHRLSYATASSMKWRQLKPWGERVSRYEQQPTKVSINNKYRSVKINDDLTLQYIRPSHPIAELEPWNPIDECVEVEVNCVGTEI